MPRKFVAPAVGEFVSHRSAAALRQLADQGLIRYRRTSGGHRRYHLEDLRRLAQAEEVEVQA